MQVLFYLHFYLEHTVLCMSSPPPTYMYHSRSRPFPFFPSCPLYSLSYIFLWNTKHGNLEVTMSLHVRTLAHKQVFLTHKLSGDPCPANRAICRAPWGAHIFNTGSTNELCVRTAKVLGPTLARIKKPSSGLSDSIYRYLKTW